MSANIVNDQQGVGDNDADASLVSEEMGDSQLAVRFPSI